MKWRFSVAERRMALSVALASFLTRIDSALFRVLLLRRLASLSRSRSVCAGHHRAACSRAGVLGRRGFAVESAVARVCREAGGRVTLKMVRDMDFRMPTTPDGWKLSQTVCHCLVAHNWPPTRLWCPRCTVMVLRGVVLLTGTV